MYKYLLLLICLPDCISGNKLFAQDDAGSRFGKVLPQEFSLTSSVVDSTANAVVLADIGSADVKSYEFGFRVEFTRFRRIRILNKPEDYPSLRDFYAGIIMKQAEDIVFKKVQ
jgi:hypothetical protein